MSERTITLIGEHEVKVSILNQQDVDSSRDNEEISSPDDCFLAKFGYTIQDLLKPTTSVKFSVIVNPKYDFYKQLSDSFTEKANYPDGLSELFARREKCMQTRKAVSITNFNNNTDDANEPNTNKTLRKTVESMRSFLSYRIGPEEDSQERNEKLDRECDDHVCIDHCRLGIDEEDSRQDFEMVVDQDENSLVDTFNNSINLELAFHSSDKFSSLTSGGTMDGNMEALSNNNGEIVDRNAGNKDVEILAGKSEEKDNQEKIKGHIVDQYSIHMNKGVKVVNKEYGQENVDRERSEQNVVCDKLAMDSIEKDSLVERNAKIANKQTMEMNIVVRASAEMDRQEKLEEKGTTLTNQDSSNKVQTVRRTSNETGCLVNVTPCSQSVPTSDTEKDQEIQNNFEKGMNTFSNPINLQPKISDINELGTLLCPSSLKQSSVTVECDNSFTVCDGSSQHQSNSGRYWNDWTCMYKRGRLDKSFNQSVLGHAYQEVRIQSVLETDRVEFLETSNRTPLPSTESPQECSPKEDLSRGDGVYEVSNECGLDVNSKIPKTIERNFESVGIDILNPNVKVVNVEVPGKDTTLVETDGTQNDVCIVNPHVNQLNFDSEGLNKTSEGTHPLTLNSKIDAVKVETTDTDKTRLGTNVSQSQHPVHLDEENSHGQALSSVGHSVNNSVPLHIVVDHLVNNISEVPADSDEIEIVFENLKKVPLLLLSPGERCILPSPTPDIIPEKLGRDKIKPHDSSILGIAPNDVGPHDKSIIGRVTIAGEPTIGHNVVSRETTEVGPTHDNLSLVTNPVKLSNDASWTDSRLSQRNQDRTLTIASPENQIHRRLYEISSPSKRLNSGSENETILSPGKYGAILSPGKYGDVRFSDLLEAAADDVRPIITARRKERQSSTFLPWTFIPLDVPVKAVGGSVKVKLDRSARRPLETSHSSHAQPKSKRVRFSENIEADNSENPPLPLLPPPEDIPPPPPEVVDEDNALVERRVTDCPVQTAPPETRDEIFISSNLEENQDNFNPEWSEVAQIYNTHRYDLIQRRWDTNTVANPKKNLTLLQYNIRATNKRRTEPIVLYERNNGEDEPLAKRPRLESCTYMFDKLIEELDKRVERVNQMFAARKREALAELKRRHHRQLENRTNKYLIMQRHREELRRFNNESRLRLQFMLNPFTSRIQKLNALREELVHFYKFYHGLSRDNELALHMTAEETEDLLCVEATISGYRESYGEKPKV